MSTLQGSQNRKFAEGSNPFPATRQEEGGLKIGILWEEWGCHESPYFLPILCWVPSHPIKMLSPPCLGSQNSIHRQFLFFYLEILHQVFIFWYCFIFGHWVSFPRSNRGHALTHRSKFCCLCPPIHTPKGCASTTTYFASYFFDAYLLFSFNIFPYILWI